MKPSGIEWIGDIPAEWNVKRLGFLFTFGKGLSITKEDLQDEGIPCVNYGEIHSKYGFEVDPAIHHLRRVDEKYLRTDKKVLLKYGDFLFADTSEDLEGSGNFTYLNSNNKAFAGYHTIILRLREEIDHRYVAYLFDSIFFRTQIRDKVWGIKVYSITQPILKNAKMILPPLEEQQTIAAFLDTQCASIDGIIAEMEQQVEILKQYKTSLITETVTKGLDKDAPMKDSGIEWIGKIPAHWEVGKIKYAASFIGSGTTPDSSNSEFYDGELNWIQSGDLYQTDLINATEKKITQKAVKKIPVLRLYKKKFLVIAMYGASIGNTAISNIDAYVNQACCCIIQNSENNMEYLYYFIQSSKNDLLLQSAGGGQPNISQIIIKNRYCLLPPLNEQKAIASFLNVQNDKIKNIIAEKRQSIETMKAYKKSLIYEYVTGKKRVM
jgi:type I restriction enzyme S subunit